MMTSICDPCAAEEVCPTVKQKRATFTVRSHRPDASIAAHTPVESGQPAPACAPSNPASAAFTPAPTLRLSWLNAERVLWIWTAIVAACVVWQPLLLGFYLDDWDLWVRAETRGSPFSLTRLLFMNFTNPVRPGCLPGRFLGSSLFGAHPLLWQGALLLVNCAVAVSIVAAARALTQAGTPAGKTITAAAGLCWLLLPWNAAARFWSALLPNTLMIAALGFLCALLVRGWAKNRPRPVAAAALYLWICLSYEAFYLQWITLILIGVVLWNARRTGLRPVLVSGVALIAAQSLAGLWNLYAKYANYWTAMPVIPDWGQMARKNLLDMAPSILRSVSEISVEIVFCGLIVIAMWLVAHVRSFGRTSERPAGITSALLAGISILGGLGSVVVYSLAGRIVAATGVDTRSMMVFNFWLIVAGAVLTTFTMERLSGAPRLVFALALAGVGLCLAVGQVFRAADWVTAWSLQKKILAEAPVSEFMRAEPDARFILVNPREVNGVPVFSASWDINNAIPWAYPFLRQSFRESLKAEALDDKRRIIVFNPWEGPMKWDGRQLSYVGHPLETAAAPYLWRPSDRSFWRPAGPFVINTNLTVEPAQ